MTGVETIKALKAIAEGYDYRIEDGIVVVENPDYQPDNGSNPFLTIEIIK